MREDFTVRRFADSDAEAVRDIICRGLREIDGKDHPAERIEEYCRYFTVEKIRAQAQAAHTYVAVSGERILGTGAISPYWGSRSESILLTIFVLPERIAS